MKFVIRDPNLYFFFLIILSTFKFALLFHWILRSWFSFFRQYKIHFNFKGRSLIRARPFIWALSEYNYCSFYFKIDRVMATNCIHFFVRQTKLFNGSFIEFWRACVCVWTIFLPNSPIVWILFLVNKNNNNKVITILSGGGGGHFTTNQTPQTNVFGHFEQAGPDWQWKWPLSP